MDPLPKVIISSMTSVISTNKSIGEMISLTVVAVIFIFLYGFLNYQSVLFSKNSLKKIVEEFEDDENKQKHKEKLKKVVSYSRDKAYIGFRFGKIFIISILAVISFAFGESLYFLIARLLPNGASSFLNQHFFPFAVFQVLFYAFVGIVVTIFGEYIPRSMIQKRKKEITSKDISLFYFFLQFFRLATSIVFSISSPLTKLLKLEKLNTSSELTEDDLLSLVGEGAKLGVFEATEHDMISNIFNFDDITVDEVMTHRTDVVALDIEDTASDVVKFAKETGYSRFPVYEEDLDNIIGILYAKDLLDLVEVDNAKDLNIKKYIKPSVFIPETNTAQEAFIEMREKKVQMSIAIDEYGGVSGIITMEDLIECIVGNIDDEYDIVDSTQNIDHLGNKEYIVNGVIPVEILKSKLSLNIEDSQDYDTLSGLLTSSLGYIPEPEDEDVFVIVNNIKFTILDNDDRKINKVLIKILSKEEIKDESPSSLSTPEDNSF